MPLVCHRYLPFLVRPFVMLVCFFDVPIDFFTGVYNRQTGALQPKVCDDSCI